MKLKSLRIKNIRSYQDTSIDFPDGVILFEGDIGAGKSTILYAIEFALFGSAEAETARKSEFYLRMGAEKGSVTLAIEIGGKEYILQRELKKGGGGLCRIISEGETAEYPPTEMRNRVLELLGFNEPRGPRSSSVIYRYAVFTPQEEMKQILWMDDDRRLQTLRKAFRIEEYRTCRENAKEASKVFARDAASSDELAGALRELEERLSDNATERKRLENELSIEESALSDTAAALAILETKSMALEMLRADRDRLRAEREKLSLRLEMLKDRSKEASGYLRALDEDRKRQDALAILVAADDKSERTLEGLEETLRAGQPIRQEAAVLSKELETCVRTVEDAEARKRALDAMAKRVAVLKEELEGKNSAEDRVRTMESNLARLREKKDRLLQELEELEKEHDEYSSLDAGKKCPKCHQELSAPHIHTLVRDVEAKLARLLASQKELAKKASGEEKRLTDGRKALRVLEGKSSELGQLEGETRALLQTVHEAEMARRKMKTVSEHLEELREQLKKTDVDEMASALRKGKSERQQRRRELSGLEGRLRDRLAKERALQELRGEEMLVTDHLGKLETSLTRNEYEESFHAGVKAQMNAARQKLGGLERSVPDKKAICEKLAAEIARLEKERWEKANRIAGLQKVKEASDYLSEFFVPAVENIERHVLGHINVQFEEMARRWFGKLAEGTDLELSMDESFSPVIHSGGYELDIRALSGGEKTAVALAYRLALNHLVKAVSAIDDRNLLILDEPTDGFSREQLDKVTELLREIGAPQLIIVSHERELEGFADHVFRIVKENGVSGVFPVKTS